jgi:alpha-1,6-mannosyltransferase
VRLTGRDPRLAVLLLAANPLILLTEVGGFHNDIYMMVPSVAAIAFLLSGRDRPAGAALAFAIAFKFTAILILPFLLIAVRPRHRKLRILSGVALAGIPLVILSVVLFGPTLPNLGDQSQLLNAYSISNLLGWAVGQGGGSPIVLKLLELLVVAVVIQQVLRNRDRDRDWVAGAGWATVALIASLAGLWPWYLVWLLPLAGIATSARLRAAALTLTVFLVITTAPYFTGFLSKHGIYPLNSPVGEHAISLVAKHSR